MPIEIPVYETLGVRPFINACGTITTLGGSIMPPQVVQAMVDASQHFVPLIELHEKVGQRIAKLTGNEGAFVCAGAASGMTLTGAACITRTDTEAIQKLPDPGDLPNEFVISMVDAHYFIHQGFELCGGKLVKVGTREKVTAGDYATGINERTAGGVFFLGSQSREQLPEIVAVAHERQIPVIVDAAAQLPPRSNLTELTGIGADLVVFSGGKGLCGPQSSGLIVGRADLIEACALNSNPYSGVGRSMKVGKEEIMGLLAAVELFMAQDEEAVIADWVKRCNTIAAIADEFSGIKSVYSPPGKFQFPPASPVQQLHFSDDAPLAAPEVKKHLKEGEPSIEASASENTISFQPQTLQDGEAEIIARRIREILAQSL